MQIHRPGFGSYFIAGLVSILASYFLTGCRFGNHVEQLVVEDPTGFYQTTPRRLSYCAKTPRENCGAATSVTPVPDSWDLVVTDPTYLYMSKADSKVGVLVNKDDLNAKSPRGVLLGLLGSGRFTYDDISGKIQNVTTDGACKSHMSFHGTGTALKAPVPAINNVPIAGSLQFNVQGITSFIGNCSPFFDDVRSCYGDASKCGEATVELNQKVQDNLIGIFGPYISNHALEIADFPFLTELSYSLSYE